jgi:hypothetical protein
MSGLARDGTRWPPRCPYLPGHSHSQADRWQGWEEVLAEWMAWRGGNAPEARRLFNHRRGGHQRGEGAGG